MHLPCTKDPKAETGTRSVACSANRKFTPFSRPNFRRNPDHRRTKRFPSQTSGNADEIERSTNDYTGRLSLNAPPNQIYDAEISKRAATGATGVPDAHYFHTALWLTSLAHWGRDAILPRLLQFHCPLPRSSPPLNRSTTSATSMKHLWKVWLTRAASELWFWSYFDEIWKIDGKDIYI